jgi:hypothetical protein
MAFSFRNPPDIQDLQKYNLNPGVFFELDYTNETFQVTSPLLALPDALLMEIGKTIFAGFRLSL